MTTGIFYIPTLDTSSTVDVVATTDGAAVTAPLGNISNLACTLIYNDAMNQFKFRTVSGDAYENFASVEGITSANFDGMPKEYDTSGTWLLPGDFSGHQNEIMQVLSRAVTGSAHGSDLFNNQLEVGNDITSKVEDCNIQVRHSMDDEASLILTNAILAQHPERFMLANEVTTDISIGDCMNTSVYKNLFCESITPDGTNASVSINVELSGNFILRMEPLEGTRVSDFSAGDSIQITDSSGLPGMGTSIILTDISSIRNATTIAGLNSQGGTPFSFDASQNTEWTVSNNIPGLFTYQTLTCGGSNISKVNVTFSGDLNTQRDSSADVFNLAMVESDTALAAELDFSMNISIADLTEDIGFVSNPRINSVGAGLINGSLYAGTPIGVPLLQGDKVQILFTINPHTNQKTLTGHELRDNEGVATMLAEYLVLPPA